MMELSAEVQDLLQRFRKLNKSHEESKKTDSALKCTSSSYEMQTSRIQDEILNLDDVNFTNDEYWLYAAPFAHVGSVQNWLYESHNNIKFTDPCLNAHPHQQIDSLGDLSASPSSAKKIFDSRTYTRPKKKFLRPSIDRYRDDYFEKAAVNKSMGKGESKPLHFDLTQPMNCSRMFDNIVKNAPDNDSFQNMSPPSLISSMCSSTFTAAMDSSIIKNDPVLREIRAADYNKAEPLMLQSLQSLTESYSSINSDSAENYLRRTLPQLLSAKTDSSECDENFYSLTGSQIVLDDKFDNDDIAVNLNDRNFDELYYDSTKTAFNNNIVNVQNDTSRGRTNRNNTKIINCETTSFLTDALTGDNKLDYESITNQYSNKNIKVDDDRKESLVTSQSEITLQIPQGTIERRILDATFNKLPEIDKSLKTSNESAIVNGTFSRSKRTFDANETFDKSRLETGDYYTTNERVFNGTFKKDKDRSKTRVIDASALRNLTCAKYGNGSGDSLDRLSVCSDSSKGSVGKMTVADIDAIVEQQEQSLLMSTPKPAKSMSKLFDQRYVVPSPIHRTLHLNKEHLSDSELSEEYATGRSSGKNKRLSMHFDNNTASSAINTTNNLNRTYKSMSNLKQPSTTGRILGSLAVVKPTPSTANYGTYRKPNATCTRAPGVIGSTAGATSSSNYARSGSEQNVPRAIGITAGSSRVTVGGGGTNLRTMGAHLKSSYTSLRPSLAHVQPPPAGQMAALRSDSASIIGAAKADKYNKQLAPMKSASDQSVPGTRINNGTIVKQRTLSALPRPVSGIPKSTSKIPGPRPFRPSATKPLTNLYYSSNAMR